MSDPSDALYYGDYLQLGRILEAQRLESARAGAPAHDEMLFIVIHQTYELWFKQILWELDAVMTRFDRERVEEEDVGRAVAHLERIVEIQKVLVQQIDVLETMTPLDFLDFRDYLIPASGFQSLQFRLIEMRLGMRDQERLRYNDKSFTERLSADDRERVTEIEDEPSLIDLVDRWLARTPFLQVEGFDFWQTYRDAVESMLAHDRAAIEENPTLGDEERASQLDKLRTTREEFEALFDARKHADFVAQGRRRLSHRAFLAALLINLYRDRPILHLPFRLLTLLMDIDEGFTLWRYRHALMVQRMIGTKIGTGGSSGHDYLLQTAHRHRVARDLFELSTFYIPRSALPPLPPSVERRLGFHLTHLSPR